MGAVSFYVIARSEATRQSRKAREYHYCPCFTRLPRRRRSSAPRNDNLLEVFQQWIPAFAGMTNPSDSFWKKMILLGKERYKTRFFNRQAVGK
jgi:hypothetical protein